MVRNVPQCEIEDAALQTYMVYEKQKKAPTNEVISSILALSMVKKFPVKVNTPKSTTHKD